MIKNRYGFHFGNEMFDAIKNRKMLGLKSTDINPDDRERYINSVSMFFNALSYDNVSKLKDNGFKPWSSDIFYLYKVDIIKNKKAIKNITFYSTPEEVEFSNKYWKEYTGNAKDMKEFMKQKKKYMEHLKREMSECKCARVPMSVEEFARHDRVDEYKQTHKYVLINLQCGSKSQYASCIPHMQLMIEKPLEWISVDLYNFKDKYKIVHFNNDNVDIYKSLYIDTYIDNFKVKYTEAEFKKHMSDSEMIVYDDDAGNFGFLRYYPVGANKHYDKISPTKEYIMLSDLASKNKGIGIGTKLLSFLKSMCDVKETSIVASLWNDDLIPYYKSQGFEIIRLKSKKFPSVMAIYKRK